MDFSKGDKRPDECNLLVNRKSSHWSSVNETSGRRSWGESYDSRELGGAWVFAGMRKPYDWGFILDVTIKGLCGLVCRQGRGESGRGHIKEHIN